MEKSTWKQKAAAFVGYMAAYSLFYILPNMHPFFPPKMLPLLPIDLTVPFLPWTFIIYLSDYLFLFYVIASTRTVETFGNFVRMAHICLFVCGMFFMFFPTTYPRPPYPLDEPFYIDIWLRIMAAADTPNNCFPSMHVAFTGIGAWAVRYQGPKVSFFMWLWAFAIFFSTLTTKQHYFVDIVGGMCVTAVVASFHWAFFEKKLFNVWLARSRG